MNQLISILLWYLAAKAWSVKLVGHEGIEFPLVAQPGGVPAQKPSTYG